MPELITWRSIKLTKRKPDSHKGQNGRVLIIGGSPEYTGAVMLAGMAAYRSGADAVVIASPRDVARVVRAWPDFMTVRINASYLKEAHANKLIRLSEGFDSLLIGNGIGLRKQTQALVRKVVRNTLCPKVIDADAIKAIGLKDTENAIITPHLKEFQTLLRNTGIKASGKESITLARKASGSNIILLKGRTDTMISREGIRLSKTGNAGMTVSGTGDVLAGLCAGLAAQKNSLIMAACASAFISGMAGDLLYREYGYGFTATDLADKVATVMKRWQ
ncbi:NAD(P)H-hydrate dehydratase [Candidatus Woesearchaeota archaeon]|nr:NAD(P)H-hydrate dehydratase [Candidatus Woesearchaeota archaeon]